jgi:nitrite reductase (NO-forming)
VTTVGLLARWRPLALAGLAGYLAGLLVALQPFARTLPRRRPHTAASWMLGAGIAWFALAVAADLVALAGSRRVVDLDGRVGRLVPAVVVGFGLQVLTGALTYLLPVVWGRGAFGNRRLTAVLEAGWRPRVAAANLGVLLLVAAPSGGWAGRAGWWLAALGLGAFVPLAAARWPGGWWRTPGPAVRPGEAARQLAARRSTEPTAGRSRKRPIPTRVTAQASSATAGAAGLAT